MDVPSKLFKIYKTVLEMLQVTNRFIAIKLSIYLSLSIYRELS